MKRIAICLSGEIRSWENVYETWEKIVEDKNVQVDYFIHTWNYNNPPLKYYHYISNKEKTSLNNTIEKYKEKVNTEEINRMIDLIKPKDFIIESQKEFDALNENQSVKMSTFLSQFYGVMRCARLKKKYETENNFIYDVVIRSRFDLNFDSPKLFINDVVEPQTIHAFHHSREVVDSTDFYYRVADMFWMSDSFTYDILADFYNGIPLITTNSVREGLPPEFSWYHYIKKSNIKVINRMSWLIKVVRKKDEYIVDRNSDYELYFEDKRKMV